ncbi:MAG: helix-turn-helix domain-containing protein [Luteitalea sp.]|nr:helix-turn-helix domain-containing protein [Luteitalea sp.]
MAARRSTIIAPGSATNAARFGHTPRVVHRHEPADASASPSPSPNAARSKFLVGTAIERALTVIECFPTSDTTLNLSEIALMSSVPESSLFRVLATLEGRGYLLRNADGSYRLAPKFTHGLLYQRAEETRAQMHPLLDQLNRRFNETTSLAFLFGDRVQVIDVIEAVQDVRATNVVGKTLPPHCSSMAKAITAFQPRERVDRILQCYGLIRLTDHTIVDRVAILDEHEEIRSRGWAREHEESAAGIGCYGVPLFDERREVIAAMSLICPLIRMTPQRETEIVNALLDVSRATTIAQPSR